jgi:hypothetical protein
LLVVSIIALQCGESGAQCARFRASNEERRVLTAYGHSALMLVAARLRHIASTKWGKRRYLVMEALLNPAKQEAAA